MSYKISALINGCRSQDGWIPETRVAVSRRDFLRLGAGVAGALVLPPAFAKATAAVERRLSFTNTHTGESLKTTYWVEGEYLDGSLQEVNAILRDHRTDEVISIDKGLLDLLFVLQSQVDSKDVYHIISGYRSPATNAMLNGKSRGVAKRSYHMRGMAIDIRLQGCELKSLQRAALALQAGGVGYYPSSDFIHVDVGPVRNW
ncbi:MAG: DUF882 domain-containing protein [Gammaproteobacteria bacterium]|nr:DUF882 domain-containing protein [Gammaproteobacteria bacterium]